MKKILLLGAAVLSCNQPVYDAIYTAIIQITLEAPKLTPKIINNKNNAIETLRKLCNEQRSSYETH